MASTDFDLDSLVRNNNFDFISALSSAEDDFDSNLETLDTPYSQSAFLTEYQDPSSLSSENFPFNNLTIFSLNIQSLPAKFTDFFDLICLLSKLKCAPDIICLQEIWKIHDSSPYSLPGYQEFIFTCRSTTQGGGWVFM